MNKVRMIQAVFEGKNKEEIRKTFAPRLSNKGLKDDQFLHHVTLLYSNVPVDADSFTFAKEGEEVLVLFSNIVMSEEFGVEAIEVIVENKQGIRYDGRKNLHVTSSTNGKPPKESNTLLEGYHNGTIKATSFEIIFDCIIPATIRHYK